MKWNVSSITQLIMAAVAAFAQVWAMFSGHSVDPTHAALAVGLAASGIGHAANNGAINGK